MKTLNLSELQVSELTFWVKDIASRIGDDPAYIDHGHFPKDYSARNPDECVELITEMGHELQRMLKEKEKHRKRKEAWKDILEQLCSA